MYKELIQSISPTTNYNEGLCEVLFTPLSALVKVPDFRRAQQVHDDGGGEIFNISNPEFEFVADKDWLTIDPVAIQHKFSDSNKTTAAGTVYNSELIITFNDDFIDTNSNNLLRSYTRQRFVLIAKQDNNVWRMMGNMKQGARLLFDYENSNKGLKNEIKFTWQSVEPCPRVSFF
jgi:hypothetical protein